ncbi:MAG: type II secretion system protein [Phycisphaerales bacterium]
MDRSRTHHRSSQGSRAAFTLIELLVCASIISMLLGTMMTGLAKARSVARGVVCQANLRTLAQATNLYYNELNDLPTTTQSVINVPANQTEIVNMLAPYHDAQQPSTTECVRPGRAPTTHGAGRWAGAPTSTTRRAST